jgi:hypothetical protein
MSFAPKAFTTGMLAHVSNEEEVDDSNASPIDRSNAPPKRWGSRNVGRAPMPDHVRPSTQRGEIECEMHTGVGGIKVYRSSGAEPHGPHAEIFFSASEVFKTPARDLISVSRINSMAAYLPSPRTAGFIFSPRAGSERLDPFDPAQNLLVSFESFGRIVEMLNRYESPERDFVFLLCCCRSSSSGNTSIVSEQRRQRNRREIRGWGGSP